MRADDYGDYTSSGFPQLTVYYWNSNGVEPYTSTTDFAFSPRGTGYINNYTGNMVLVENLFHLDSERLPMDLNLVYNATKYENRHYYTTDGKGASTGYGFMLDFQQRLVEITDPALLNSARRILALEGVQDPGNVGTLLRSAAAFGFDAVVLGPGCAAPFSPKTLRSSMGAAGRLPVLHSDDLPATLQALRQRGVTCLAAALYRSRPLNEAGREFPGGVCVVIGSEGQGLRDETVEACDAAVRIPMTDRVESQNAGVAGSVLLWHFRGVE